MIYARPKTAGQALKQLVTLLHGATHRNSDDVHDAIEYVNDIQPMIVHGELQVGLPWQAVRANNPHFFVAEPCIVRTALDDDPLGDYKIVYITQLSIHEVNAYNITHYCPMSEIKFEAFE